MTVARVKRNAAVLRALAKVDNITRATVLKSAKADLVHALVDCAQAIINNSERLTPAQLRKIRASAKHIGDLLRPGSVQRKRVILQRGGFISSLIGPIALLILPKILGGVLGGLGGRSRR